MYNIIAVTVKCWVVSDNSCYSEVLLRLLLLAGMAGGKRISEYFKVSVDEFLFLVISVYVSCRHAPFLMIVLLIPVRRAVLSSKLLRLVCSVTPTNRLKSQAGNVID